MSKNSPSSFEEKEIDMSAISRNIGGAFQSLSSFIFGCIQFFLRNIIIVGILFILGVALGIYLDKTQKTYDHQIIVTPNFGSVDYLYSKIDLINSKINEGDTSFLRAIGLKNPDMLIKIEIKPITDVYRFINHSELNFEMLKLLADEGDVKKIVEEKATSKNYTYHIIYFSTKDFTTTTTTTQPLLNYLNNSEFLAKVQKEYLNNVMLKLKANEQTLTQIDGILNEFAKTASGSNGSNLVYINENTQLNDVLETKNKLIEEQGNHRINLISMDKIIKENSAMLNAENNESVNGKLKFVLPLLFIGFFILIYLIRSFYRSQALKHKSN